MDAALFSFLAFVSIHIVSASVVNTTIGEIQGTELLRFGVETFLGIPYAEAPVGSLRFKPPVRKNRMDSTYQAVTNEYICPQERDLIVRTGNVTITEDCLRLDIYKPFQASKNKPVPVMIWIHGGSFITGDSQSYNGVSLATDYDVIVVVINYRLGIFGFLDTLDENAVGNFGLRDQCSAIEWVSENIEEFGGNSSSVTIFGESAGSACAMQLALSSLCYGKFHRIVAQSGTAWNLWSHNRQPLKLARDTATKAGCPKKTGPLVKCLREKPMQELVRLQTSQFIWLPTYRPDVFPEDPISVMKSPASSDVLNRFRSLDLLIGVNNEEGEFAITFEITGQIFGTITNKSAALISDDALDGRMRSNLEIFVTQDYNITKNLLPMLKYEYTDWKNLEELFANTRTINRFMGDLLFVVNAVQAARYHAGDVASPQGAYHSGNTYFYQFVHKSSWLPVYPWTDGATHGDELQYLFGFPDPSNATPEETLLSKTVKEYWTNFAKTGSPNTPNRSYIQTTWPLFNTATQRYVKLDVNMSHDSTSKYPYARRVALWECLVPAQEKAFEKSRNIVDDTKCNTATKTIGSIAYGCLLHVVITAGINVRNFL
ncbi:carboxylesterase 5A-like [Liolophura sinensis]|uniref:carboxylesterase 5A-like n=1 Tax=Liolophura sinensis TaxID=3198878 RepID=UPI003159958D